MHSQNCVHRDIKPDNVLIFLDGAQPPILKIADLGMAREVAEKPMTKEVCTTWYRAPEVFNEAAYGSPVDLWSAGCVIVELFSGYYLFPERDDKSMMVAIDRVLKHHLLPREHPRVLNGSYPEKWTQASESSAASGDNRVLKVLMGEDSPPNFVSVAIQCLRLDPAARISAADAVSLLEDQPHGEPVAASRLLEREPAGTAAADEAKPLVGKERCETKRVRLRFKVGILNRSFALSVQRKLKTVARVADEANPLVGQEAQQVLSGHGGPCQCTNVCGSKEHFSSRHKACTHTAVFQCKGRSHRWLCQHCICRMCKASPARGHGTCYGCKAEGVKEGAAGRKSAAVKRRPAAAGSFFRAWPTELQIARLIQDLLPKLWPCDLQCYLGTAGHMPLALDVFIMLLKEPWAVREFKKALGTTSPASDAQSLARQIGHSAADMCKQLPSPIRVLDERVAFERASISRQYGLLHMGFIATMKRFGILKEVQPPQGQPCVKRARTASTQLNPGAESEQLFYGGRWFAVQRNPCELQEFVKNLQAFDATMGSLSAVSSVHDLRVYCMAMASRMPQWLGGSDGLKQYVVPHCVRKFWLRIEGLCDKGAWSTDAAGRSFTPAALKSAAFAKFFENISLKEVLELCPDSAQYMQCLPNANPIQVLKRGLPNEHPLMVSAWACLLHDATSKLGPERCLDIAQKCHRSLIEALDALLLTRGTELPPNLYELFRNIS